MATVLSALALVAVGSAADRGVGWAVDPGAWLILLVLTLPWAAAMMDKNIAAGADWLRRGRKWLDLYALETVRMTEDNGRTDLTLTAADQRWVRVSTIEIQQVPAAWALVYNGIRHSVDSGARLAGNDVHRLGLGGPTSSPDPVPDPPRRGPGRWALGLVLLTVSVTSVIGGFVLGSQEVWFGDEGFDLALGLALCVVLQLCVCSVAIGVGNVGLEGALGVIAYCMVPIGLLFAPVGVGLGVFDDRGTGVVVGMAVGVVLVAVAVWLMNNRARLVFVIGRLGRRG